MNKRVGRQTGPAPASAIEFVASGDGIAVGGAEMSTYRRLARITARPPREPWLSTRTVACP